MAQVTGRVVITVGGKRYATREGATLKFSNVSRQGEAADTGVVGYSEKTEIPEVSCVIVHTADVSIKEIESIKDASISFDTDTGRSFLLSEAWNVGALELTKGEISTRFQGIKCEEV